jgi:hypothetical protein
MKTFSQYLAWLLSLAAALSLVAIPCGEHRTKRGQGNGRRSPSVITDQGQMSPLAEERYCRFDFRQMTQLAVGPAWKRPTRSSGRRWKAAFARATYTGSLRAAGGEKGRNQTCTAIGPERYRRENAGHAVRQAADLDRQPMENKPGGWKVFDVLVEGVSLVTTYRGTFSEKWQSGIDGLIGLRPEPQLAKNWISSVGAIDQYSQGTISGADRHAALQVAVHRLQPTLAARTLVRETQTP